MAQPTSGNDERNDEPCENFDDTINLSQFSQLTSSDIHSSTQIVPTNIEKIMEDLSETTRNPTDGFHEDTDDILSHINSDRFFTPVKPKKRTGKAKDLLDEQFLFNVYKIHQAGFTTTNPIKWVLAIEHYVKLDPEVKYKVAHRYGADNLITNTRFQVWYGKISTTFVTILINHVQGLFMVQGSTFETWIIDNFEKVIRNMGEDVKTKHQSFMSGVISADPPTAHNTEPSTDNKEIVDNLWEELSQLKVAVTALDRSNLELAEKIPSPGSFHDMESRLDSKIAVFSKVIEKEIKKQVDAFSKRTNNALASIRADVCTFKEEMQAKMENIRIEPDQRIRRIEEDIELTKNELSKLDFQGLSMAFTTESEITEAELLSHRRKIHHAESEIVTSKNLIEKITKEFKTQKQLMDHVVVKKIIMAEDQIRALSNNINVVCKGTTNKTTTTDNKATTNTNNNSNSGNNNNNTENDNINRNKGDDLDIIMCFDSNRKFINFRKLWTLRGSSRHRSGQLSSVKRVVESCKAKQVKYFLISVGTNDIDTKEPDDIIHEYSEIIDLLKKKYPGIHVIINELPPRKERNNDKVQKMNGLLNQLCLESDSLTIITQEKLRGNIDRNMFDDKHVHRRAVNLFAGSIKQGLRKAYGLPEPKRRGDINP